MALADKPLAGVLETLGVLLEALWLLLGMFGALLGSLGALGASSGFSGASSRALGRFLEVSLWAVLEVSWAPEGVLKAT